ncbi:cytochrome P450-dit2 [Trebouxia sp. C0009 RCD-2024]
MQAPQLSQHRSSAFHPCRGAAASIKLVVHRARVAPRATRSAVVRHGVLHHLSSVGSAGRCASRQKRCTAAQRHVPQAAATSGATVADADAPAPGWPGAKPVPLLLSIAIGVALRFLVPIPSGITIQAWTLLSIFVSTITGLVLEPLPTGAWAFLSVTAAVFTKTLTFSQAFSAFCNDVIWLIVVSFFFAKGFEKTGLGERVATLFVKAFGKSTLGLAYGLAFAEGLIAPAMPSTTARAGGIFMPIMKSLSETSGSLPGTESASKLGKFLVQAQFQGSVHTSALFLTAAAQNLLCLKLATEMGVVIASPWVTWLKGAFAPALVGLLVTPFIMYKLCPPEIKDTPQAPAAAAERLQKMGPMSRDEKIMLGTMAFAVVLWVTGDAIGVSSVVAAMLGLSVLLVTGVLKWKDCLNYPPAWDTLFWFAVLVGMSGQLNSLGVIKYFADVVGGKLVAMNMGWPAVFGLLNLAYFLLHYMFASQTAHVGALYSAFLAMMLSAGVPGMLAALSLAYCSNLFGSVTHYGSGQGAVYYGAGYVSLKEIFSMGALMAVINLTIWGVVGAAWWKVLGFY